MLCIDSLTRYGLIESMSFTQIPVYGGRELCAPVEEEVRQEGMDQEAQAEARSSRFASREGSPLVDGSPGAHLSIGPDAGKLSFRSGVLSDRCRNGPTEWWRQYGRSHSATLPARRQH